MHTCIIYYTILIQRRYYKKIHNLSYRHFQEIRLARKLVVGDCGRVNGMNRGVSLNVKRDLVQGENTPTVYVSSNACRRERDGVIFGHTKERVRVSDHYFVKLEGKHT